MLVRLLQFDGGHARAHGSHLGCGLASNRSESSSVLLPPPRGCCRGTRQGRPRRGTEIGSPLDCGRRSCVARQRACGTTRSGTSSPEPVSQDGGGPETAEAAGDDPGGAGDQARGRDRPDRAPCRSERCANPEPGEGEPAIEPPEGESVSAAVGEDPLQSPEPKRRRSRNRGRHRRKPEDSAESDGDTSEGASPDGGPGPTPTGSSPTSRLSTATYKPLSSTSIRR